MEISILLPFIVLIGAMYLMTRSAKNKQRQMTNMRDQMQPGSGVRTIGGMYATVKEVHDDTILLEVAPGVHAVYAKNSIGAILDDAEYNRIVHGATEFSEDEVSAPDDASSLTEADDADESDDTEDADVDKVDLGKESGDEASDDEGKQDGGTAAR